MLEKGGVTLLGSSPSPAAQQQRGASGLDFRGTLRRKSCDRQNDHQKINPQREKNLIRTTPRCRAAATFRTKARSGTPRSRSKLARRSATSTETKIDAPSIDPALAGLPTAVRGPAASHC